MDLTSLAKPVGALPRAKLVSSRRAMRATCLAAVFVGDMGSLAVAFLLANALYWRDAFDSHGVNLFIALAPIYVGLAALHRTYSPEVILAPRAHVSGVVLSLFQAAVAGTLFAYMFKVGDQFSRASLGIGLVLALMLMTVTRLMLGRALLKPATARAYSVIVIRDGVPYSAAEQEMVVTPEQLDFDPATTDPFRFHAFANLVGDADRVIVACPRERYDQWAAVLKSMTAVGEILIDERDHIGILGVGAHRGRSTMVVGAGPLKWHERFVKRTFDLVAASAGCILLAPLFAIVALAIRIESAGPIFFKQDRIGRDNRIFRIYKFRSMFHAAADGSGSVLTARNDSRVTKVGEFIRRTSIDELPQLLNVLKGDMSIVGPRPHPLGAKAADQLYWDIDARYRHRHSIKPGLTGLAQVRGFRGNTERVEDLTNRLQADLEYALRWSLWNDLLIIGRTLLVVRHSNAF